jgi:hypothetical protein
MLSGVRRRVVQEPGGKANRRSDEAGCEIDRTLVDWFLTLSPWERLQSSANWAKLAALRRVEAETD